jgi:hypothetical protein
MTTPTAPTETTCWKCNLYPRGGFEARAVPMIQQTLGDPIVFPHPFVMTQVLAESLQVERHLVAKCRACEMEVHETREEMRNTLQELEDTRKELEETRKELEDTRKQLELLRLSSGA